MALKELYGLEPVVIAKAEQLIPGALDFFMKIFRK